MNTTKEIWIVVEVNRGILVKVNAFGSLEAAEKYEKQRRSQLNLDNDEMGIFNLSIENLRGWN